MLKGQGFAARSYTSDGTETVDPAEAEYFFVDDPDIMVAIDQKNATIRFHKGKDIPLDDIMKLHKQIRTLANNNVLNFEFKVLGKEITPREYSHETKRKETTMEAILEGFTKLKGSTKTSYQTLESVRLVIHHKIPVNEEVRGSRSRNIKAIFVECHGERFRFPVNDLRGARSMARHINEGGKIDDTVGNYIVEAVEKTKKLREFVRYAKTNKLINEGTADIVELVQENILTLTKDLHKLTGVKTYESIKSRIEESTEEILAEENMDELRDKFTVKRFDEKFLDILPTVNSMMNEKQSFLRMLEESSEADIMLDADNFINDTIVEHTTTEGKMASHLHMIAASMMENEELAKFVGGIASKLNEATELTAFESTILGNVLKNVKVDEGIGRKIGRTLTRMNWGGDGRSPQELRDQIRELPDHILLKWAEDPSWGVGAKNLQTKLIKQEMKRRGIGDIEEGYTILDPIDQEHYSYQERNPDLDRPRRYMPSGIVVFYDAGEGRFYDRGQDRYLEQEEVDALERAEHEWRNSQPEFGDLRSEGLGEAGQKTGVTVPSMSRAHKKKNKQRSNKKVRQQDSKQCSMAEEQMFEAALDKHRPENIF